MSPRLLSFALVVVVGLAGCGGPSGGSRGSRVATAQRPASTGAPATSAPAAAETDYDKARRYVRCMNDHGVTIPDPVVGEPLQVWTYASLNGGSVTGIDDKFRLRIRPPEFDKCKHHLPATWPVKADPKEIARDRPFGECLRKHGVYWPEPDPNGMMRYPADHSVYETREYEAAEQACRHLVDDPAVKQR